MKEIIVIAHDIRSAHNVGSILRTADGLGINKIYLTGYSPYPISDNDTRLPYLASKISTKISKTSLGAENSVNWEFLESASSLILELKSKGFEIWALEQAKNSTPLPDSTSGNKIALVLGNETQGIDQEILNIVDKIIEIPMYGKKESFNVSVAAAIALYHLRYQA